MTADERAALLRVIAAAIYRQAKDDPDMLAALPGRPCRAW
jgi:hypothetical protein